MLESNATRRLEQDNRVWRETRREPIPETLHIVRRHEPRLRFAVGHVIERSRKLLVELIEATQKKGFPGEKIVLGGFSQGSLMSVEVGLRYPQRLAGIVGISGYVCNPEKLIAQLSPVAFKQRLLLTHGTLDPLIPFALVREQVNALKAAGLHIEWHEFVKPHTIAGESELEVIRDFICASYDGR